VTRRTISGEGRQKKTDLETKLRSQKSVQPIEVK